jgi:Nif-specific regulatory protein
VLQERRFERIGGTSPVDVDVRIICATNRNLEEAVKRGTFRDDLYFRINVFPVTIPPLRARREDVDALIDHFLQRFARELPRPNLRITAEARELLRGYDWPGNIRELQNCIERAAILCDRNTIDVRDISVAPSNPDALREAVDLTGTLDEATSRATRIIEKLKIEDALSQSANRTAAAELLGISPRSLAAKMKELEIE